MITVLVLMTISFLVLNSKWCIIATFLRDGRVEERPRGGPNNVKVDEEMRQCLNEIIDENCLLTLAQTNQELRRRLPAKPFIHGRTVGKALDELLFSVKRVRPLPAERNRPDVIQKRFDYASWFLNDMVINHCIFTDECGYNIWTARGCGRGRVGDRAYRQVCGQRGRNVTICLAISPNAGLIHHKTMQGGMNRDRFNEFLVQVSARLNEHEMQTSTLLAMKLPPYSPFLNIVEQAISALKAAIKRDISRHAVQVEMGN